jgi:hypothetical protein
MFMQQFSGPGSLCWKGDYSITVATKSIDQALDNPNDKGPS